MTRGEPSPETARILAECWSASQEDEELLSFATEHLDECWPTLRVLATSSLPGCRWQVYAAIAGVGRPAEDVLRKGLLDEDPYARRRALLSLAKVRPADAQNLAERFTRDPDPYMRQAAIEMILASTDKSFQRNAIIVLKTDPVEHVRKAAESAWQRILASA
jgi:HEAT repeat protein